MHSFLLIDDHVVVRTGIKLLLNNMYPDSTIDEAKDGEETLKKLKECKYEFAILDVQMPNTDSLALMETMRVQFPNIRVLVFSMNAESMYALRFMKAGAMGFISKEAPMDEVKKAILQVVNGKKYISEEMLFVLAESTNAANNNNPFSLLSTREFEIVTLLLSGKTISVIAADLNLGISTVGTHKGRIFTKLKVSNLIELKELANSFNLK